MEIKITTEQLNAILFHTNETELISDIVMNNDIEMFHLLLHPEVCFDLHQNDCFALRIAAAVNNVEMLKFLVLKGAIVNSLDDDALGIACENGNLEAAEFLIENGANIHTHDDYPLKVARNRNHIELQNYLWSVMRCEK